VVGRLGPQPVGHGEHAVDVPHVERARQRRELVHDHVGFGLADRLGHGVGIERVGHDRPSARRPQPVLLGGGPGHGHDLVAVGDQHGEQLGAQCTRCAGNENPHGIS
jgi:hypothetical protein